MRFISHHRKTRVRVQSPVVEVIAGGGRREVRRGLTAEFKQTEAPTAAELEFAERRFKTNGRTTELDTVTPTSLLGRLAVFDSERAQEENNWTDEERVLVEEKMIERAKTSQTFAVITPPPVVPPWPNYDSFPGDSEDLVGVLVEQGHHLPSALEYEQQNQNRPEVTAALEVEIERLKAEQPSPDFITA